MEDTKTLEERAAKSQTDLEIVSNCFGEIFKTFENASEPEKTLLGIIIMLKMGELNNVFSEYADTLQEKFKGKGKHYA